MAQVLEEKESKTYASYKYMIDEVVVCGERQDKLRILAPIRLKDGYKKNGTVNTRKGYYAHCLACNNLIIRKETNFEQYGCSVCNGNACKWNINSVAAKRPDLIPFFKKIEDAYENAIESHKKVDFVCPYCKHDLPQKIIKNVVNQGLYCPYCSDGISMGEKIMRIILQLLEEEFVSQATFPWIQDRIYDFYLPKRNAIIEMHGEQHYEGGSSFEKLKPNSESQFVIDNQKEKAAQQNGISQYIIIDCRQSSFDFIVSSIKSNPFFISNFNLSKIDWRQCEEMSAHSMVRICADMWNDKWSATDIRKQYHYGSSSINNWLNQAQKIGLCTPIEYNKEEANRRHGTKCINTNTLECFWSFGDCARYNQLEFGSIANRCYNQRLGFDTLKHYVEINHIENAHAFFKQHLIEFIN